MDQSNHLLTSRAANNSVKVSPSISPAVHTSSPRPKALFSISKSKDFTTRRFNSNLKQIQERYNSNLLVNSFDNRNTYTDRKNADLRAEGIESPLEFGKKRDNFVLRNYGSMSNFRKNDSRNEQSGLQLPNIYSENFIEQGPKK